MVSAVVETTLADNFLGSCKIVLESFTILSGKVAEKIMIVFCWVVLLLFY